MRVALVDAFVLEEYGYALERRIFEENGIEFQRENCRSAEEVVRRCAEADVLLSIYTKVDGPMMDALPRCRGLVRYGVGYDAFDVPAATERGILVCNIPDYCQPEVAAHTMALVLGTTRQLRHFDAQVRAGNWDTHPGRTMRRPSSQVLGLAGFGSIARLVAQYAKPFGFSVIAHDPLLPENVFAEHGVRRVSFKELLEQSDILSCHVPLSDSTFRLFDKNTFAKMKDGVILINTSRGALVCEADLIGALRSGKIGAAGLDVLESEPIRTVGHPLVTMNNVILTPHSAYESAEASYEQHKRVAETAVHIVRGEIPPNTVNKNLLDAEAVRARRG